MKAAFDLVTPSKGRYVVLLHDQYQATANGVGGILNVISSYGYVFVFLACFTCRVGLICRYTPVTLDQCFEIQNPYRTAAQNQIGGGAGQSGDLKSGGEKVGWMKFW